jgi:ABC-type phosphate/phosphonate transport system permease subunit
MRTLLRRARGVLVTALLWGVAWGLPAALVLLSHAAGHAGRRPGDEIWRAFLGATLSIALLGAFCGAVFALVLTLLEQRQTLDQLASRRVAAWGALGGLVVLVVVLAVAVLRSWGPRELGTLLLLCAMMGAMGVGCSTVALALARRPTSSANPD